MSKRARSATIANLSRRLVGFDPFLGANPTAASWKGGLNLTIISNVYQTLSRIRPLPRGESNCSEL